MNCRVLLGICSGLVVVMESQGLQILQKFGICIVVYSYQINQLRAVDGPHGMAEVGDLCDKFKPYMTSENELDILDNIFHLIHLVESIDH